MVKNGGLDGELTFVVTTNPFDASSAANKKQVRSIAALKSWPGRRKRTFEQISAPSSSSEPYVFHGSEPTLSAPSTASGSSRHREVTDAPRPANLAKRQKVAAPVPATIELPPVPSEPDEPPLFEKCSRAVCDDCKCQHCEFERRIGINSSRARRWRWAGDLGSSSGSDDDAANRDTQDEDGNDDRPANPQARPPEAGVESSHARPQVLTPPISPRPDLLDRAGNVDATEPSDGSSTPHRRWFDHVLLPSESSPGRSATLAAVHHRSGHLPAASMGLPQHAPYGGPTVEAFRDESFTV